MNEDKNDNRQYFEHKNVRIIINEHFNESGKNYQEIIKDAIIRNANTTIKV